MSECDSSFSLSLSHSLSFSLSVLSLPLLPFFPFVCFSDPYLPLPFLSLSLFLLSSLILCLSLCLFLSLPPFLCSFLPGFLVCLDFYLLWVSFLLVIKET